MTDPARKISVMAILNLTPDSYYAPSRHNMAQLSSGADIIDVGAMSTRSGAADVSESEEWARLEPVLGSLPEGLEISIDTFRSGIVRKAYDVLGRTFIVNDISAGEDDPAMLETVAGLGLGYVAMHKKGDPRTMQSLCRYEKGVTEEVLEYFDGFALRASRAGLGDWMLDPGFGFAKTVQQNYQLMDDLGLFARFGRRILVGVSRKSMLYRPLGITPEEALPSTQALHMAALERGADVLRVHDPEEASRTIEVYRMLHGVA